MTLSLYYSSYFSLNQSLRKVEGPQRNAKPTMQKMLNSYMAKILVKVLARSRQTGQQNSLACTWSRSQMVQSSGASSPFSSHALRTWMGPFVWEGCSWDPLPFLLTGARAVRESSASTCCVFAGGCTASAVCGRGFPHARIRYETQGEANSWRDSRRIRYENCAPSSSLISLSTKSYIRVS